MSPTKAVLAGLALVGLVSTGAQANLLANGSFEDTTNFVDQGNDTMTLGPGSTAMTGWTVISNDVAWIGPTNPFGVTASDGGYSLDLQGYTDSAPFGGVTQNLTTVIGGHYLLTFDLGSFANAQAAITASAGTGNQTFTSLVTNAFGWQTESLDFTATSTTTLVSLLGQQEGDAYIGLDNVSVTCTSSCTAQVPEPASGTLMLADLAGLGVVLWALRNVLRRKTAVTV